MLTRLAFHIFSCASCSFWGKKETIILFFPQFLLVAKSTGSWQSLKMSLKGESSNCCAALGSAEHVGEKLLSISVMSVLCLQLVLL